MAWIKRNIGTILAVYIAVIFLQSLFFQIYRCAGNAAHLRHARNLGDRKFRNQRAIHPGRHLWPFRGRQRRADRLGPAARRSLASIQGGTIPRRSDGHRNHDRRDLLPSVYPARHRGSGRWRLSLRQCGRNLVFGSGARLSPARHIALRSNGVRLARFRLFLIRSTPAPPPRLSCKYPLWGGGAGVQGWTGMIGKYSSRYASYSTRLWNGTSSRSRPLRKVNSIRQAAATTSAPTCRKRLIDAIKVPPVASRSSRTTTR